MVLVAPLWPPDASGLASQVEERGKAASLWGQRYRGSRKAVLVLFPPGQRRHGRHPSAHVYKGTPRTGFKFSSHWLLASSVGPTSSIYRGHEIVVHKVNPDQKNV